MPSVYEIVTEKIISQLEAGVIPWQKPWKIEPPKNLISGKGASEGNWYPACGGTEVEFKSRTGRRLLYCWQPLTGRHEYLDLDSDIVLSDDEAQIALGM